VNTEVESADFSLLGTPFLNLEINYYLNELKKKLT